jgi:hypothetical protein
MGRDEAAAVETARGRAEQRRRWRGGAAADGAGKGGARERERCGGRQRLVVEGEGNISSSLTSNH